MERNVKIFEIFIHSFLDLKNLEVGQNLNSFFLFTVSLRLGMTWNLILFTDFRITLKFLGTWGPFYSCRIYWHHEAITQIWNTLCSISTTVRQCSVKRAERLHFQTTRLRNSAPLFCNWSAQRLCWSYKCVAFQVQSFIFRFKELLVNNSISNYQWVKWC